MSNPAIQSSGVLSGTIRSECIIAGAVQATGTLAGKVITPPGYTEYSGSYEVTPTINEQIMNTEDRHLNDDIIVHAIPFQEVDNNQSGTTIIIGGI